MPIKLRPSLYDNAKKRVERTERSIDQEIFFGKAEKRLNKLDEHFHKEPEDLTAPKQTFWYVFGFTKEGKKVILGPKMSAQEADTTLATMDDGEIFELKTRDPSRATREIKAILLERTENPDYAIERMKHQIPERK